MTNFKKVFFSSIKTLNLKFRILLQSRSGQSLGEVLVGLTIGAILIGAASFLVVNTLRSNASLEKSQKGVQIAQELLDKARSWGSADWFNIYDLSKGSSNKYFLNASSSELFSINGEEGILSDDVTYGLVGHWKMDEATSTTVYDAMGDYNGSMYGSPIRSTSTCKIAYCLDFNGSTDYVNIPDSDGLDIGQPELTVSAWINPDTLTATTFAVVNKNSPYLLWIDGTNKRVTTGLQQGVTWYWAYGGSNSIATSTWTHILFSYDGTSRKIYVNGAQSGNTDTQISGNISVGTASINLGRDGCCNRYYFNGKIDDVRVYNRALSADEIKQIYESSVYTRSFSVENVCRSTGATGEITGSGDSCAGGSANDPSTQQITVSVGWVIGATSTQLSLTDYLTRWKNAIFEQADWSGGLDTSGSYTNSSDSYSSTTNTNIGTGVILELP
jgi:type II secretory pathway pseudopilin PulG